MISVSKSLGIIRNKTYLLTEYKLAISQKKAKYPKRDSENQKTQSLLSTKLESSSQVIELTPGQKSLPPLWIDTYDDTQQKLKDLSMLFEEIRKLSGKRKMAVSDNEIRRVFLSFAYFFLKIDQELHDQTGRVTKKIRDCEKNLLTIKQFTNQNETQNDLQGDDLGYLQRAAENKLQMNQDDEENEGQVQGDMMMEELNLERDQEINQLIESINELTYLFKTLNTMVIEQGTILDRIDYNIEKAYTSTKQANVQLKKADDYQKSPRAKYCMLILLLLIAVFSVLVIIKFTK